MNLTKIMLQICPTKMSLNNILDIQEPILINDILPANENLSMLHILSETPGWIMQNEANINRFDSAFTNDYPETGWGLVATEKLQKIFTTQI